MAEAAVGVSSPRASVSSAAAAAAAASLSSPRAALRAGGGAQQQFHHRRWAAPAISPPYRAYLVALWLVGFVLVFLWQSPSVGRARLYGRPPLPVPRRAPSAAKADAMGQWVAAPPEYDLREFGGVGDGRTLNTAAFEAAVTAIAERGGGRLTVPAGRWLTAPFNLTSHMTLFLASGAEILGIQVRHFTCTLHQLA
jgi:hypothetical protein